MRSNRGNRGNGGNRANRQRKPETRNSNPEITRHHVTFPRLVALVMTRHHDTFVPKPTRDDALTLVSGPAHCAYSRLVGVNCALLTNPAQIIFCVSASRRRPNWSIHSLRRMLQ